jgi:hypothetical protein
VLITEYFQQIESQLADCMHILEIDLHKDKRSLHIGIIEGKIIFIDENMWMMVFEGDHDRYRNTEKRNY